MRNEDEGPAMELVCLEICPVLDVKQCEGSRAAVALVALVNS